MRAAQATRPGPAVQAIDDTAPNRPSKATVAANDRFLITCEHGGNRIPAACRDLFDAHRALLSTHRGYDPGALVMARQMARALEAPLISSVTSRLLVDLNRSIGHPRLYSEATRDAPLPMRREIVQRYYLPYRGAVEGLVAHAVAQGRRVVHVSSHSFTPVLDGQVRTADIGLLYDPARPGEVDLCERWRAALQARAPGLRVRRNYPYLGKGDGLTSALRKRFEPTAYVGVELEVNQKHVIRGGTRWAGLRASVVDALRDALGLDPR